MKQKEKMLGKVDILALALGSIIGWGSFTLPGTKFLSQSGVINTAIGLILGGVAITFILSSYQIMMGTHSEDGGEFSYAYSALGRKHGFIVGWSLILCYLSMVPLNATAFVLVLKELLGSKANFLYLYTIGGSEVFLSDVLLASLVIIVFARINIKGLKLSSRIQNLMMLLTVANILVLFLLMIKNVDLEPFKQTYIAGQSFDLAQIAKVFAIVPFLFVGFDVIPQVYSDLNFSPVRAIQVTIFAIFAGVLFYNINNIMTAFAFSPSEALAEEWALGTAILKNVGKIGFVMLLISLSGAVSSGINGFMLGGSRLVSALSQYELMPKKYQEENENGVTKNAILFIMGISLIAPWFGRQVIVYIVDMSSLLAALVYAYVSLISLRKTKGVMKIFNFLGLIVSVSFILLLTLPSSPGRLTLPSFLFLIAWTLLGIIYYHRYNK